MVLHFFYHISLYLPPFTEEPREFLLYGPGFLKAQALREVDKILSKHALEFVLDKNTTFYSRMFLSKEAAGGQRLIIDIFLDQVCSS